MPEFFLELFSEEIPAWQQLNAAVSLGDLVSECLAPLKPMNNKEFSGPRRLAIKVDIEEEVPRNQVIERGPRVSAPEQAVLGFMRKYNVDKAQLTREGDFWFLRKNFEPICARDLILKALPDALARISWRKSMRWGGSKDFAWIRPLRRMVCLLGSETIPLSLGPITASNGTEGHRVLAPGLFEVSSTNDWKEKLRSRYVIVDREERKELIAKDLNARVEQIGLTLISDETLIEEVSGLVEWPVVMIGNIDKKFMELPPEVRELSMKINQKYFGLRDKEGEPAPHFAFVANIEATDDGVAIISGNERVLRARLSDAQHFLLLDLKTSIKDLLPKLENVTFHAKIGNQRARAERIAILAKKIASENTGGFDRNIQDDAEWAGRLCKVDLVTNLVAEFPELQGLIGGYYAKQNGWKRDIPLAIKTHYQPKGPTDDVPRGIVSCAVALADKLDSLIEFFRIGEVPTGSGDPYALRRAALGVSRIILENKLDFSLRNIITNEDVFAFIIERLRVKLKGEGKRHDVLAAVFASTKTKNLLHLMFQVEALSTFLLTSNGANLLAAYRRAANILKIEDAKDGPHEGEPNASFYEENAEINFSMMLDGATAKAISEITSARYAEAMAYLSFLRDPVDDFFLKVTVNSDRQELRINRLNLLAKFRNTMHQIADFSKLEG